MGGVYNCSPVSVLIPKPTLVAALWSLEHGPPPPQYSFITIHLLPIYPVKTILPRIPNTVAPATPA